MCFILHFPHSTSNYSANISPTVHLRAAVYTSLTCSDLSIHYTPDLILPTTPTTCTHLSPFFITSPFLAFLCFYFCNNLCNNLYIIACIEFFPFLFNTTLFAKIVMSKHHICSSSCVVTNQFYILQCRTSTVSNPYNNNNDSAQCAICIQIFLKMKACRYGFLKCDTDLYKHVSVALQCNSNIFANPASSVNMCLIKKGKRKSIQLVAE